MDTYTIYVVEGYESYDKKTNTYKNVVRIEVIAPDEKTALKKAKTMMEAPHYKVWGAYEKQVAGDFTKEEKTYIMFSYQEMGRYYRTQNAIFESRLKDFEEESKNKTSQPKNEKPKSM